MHCSDAGQPPLPSAAKTVLCYVTDRRTLPAAQPRSATAALVETAARIASLGVDWIEVREKDLSGGLLLQLASEICQLATWARILVNDRLDVALAAGAGGVHLSGDGLPLTALRGWLGGARAGSFLIGKSCHSLEEARAAETDGADYIFFGPVFATPSKLAYGPPQGINRLATVCRTLRIPVIAIGGITPENASECIVAGAQGLAAIRCFQQPEGLSDRVAQLRAAAGG